MAITDLTGTTWKLKDALYSYAANTTSYFGVYNITSIIGDLVDWPTTLFTFGYSPDGHVNTVIARTADNVEDSVFVILADGHNTTELPDIWQVKEDLSFTMW